MRAPAPTALKRLTPLFAAVLAGCASAPTPLATTVVREELRPMAATGRVLTRDDVRQRTTSVIFGDDVYAEVNSVWLGRFYGEFQAELRRFGVAHWDERFDCNRIVDFYISLAQLRFYREAHETNTSAKALALAPYWYRRADGSGSHAVVQALTERGRVFIDPQTGVEVQLTPQEHATAYFLFF